MSEYILDEEKVMRHETILPEKLEVIVRCRDCKHFVGSPRGYGCSKHAAFMSIAEPDGFCAWGERRSEICGWFEDGSCRKGDACAYALGFSYTFPHLHRFDGLEPRYYVAKVMDEAREVSEQWLADGCLSDALIIEVMDTMQACETLLRNSGRDISEVYALFQAHNAKDEARGYGIRDQRA